MHSFFTALEMFLFTIQMITATCLCFFKKKENQSNLPSTVWNTNMQCFTTQLFIFFYAFQTLKSPVLYLLRYILYLGRFLSLCFFALNVNVSTSTVATVKDKQKIQSNLLQNRKLWFHSKTKWKLKYTWRDRRDVVFLM